MKKKGVATSSFTTIDFTKDGMSSSDIEKWLKELSKGCFSSCRARSLGNNRYRNNLVV